MADEKISSFTPVTTPIPTDLIPIVRSVSGVNTNYVIEQINLISNSTTSTVGLIQLAGDLSGTAISPTVPGLTNKANINSPTFTGTPSVPNLTSTDSSTTIANTLFVHTLVDPLKVDNITIFMNGVISNKNYPIIVSTPFAFTITQLNAILNAGTCQVSISNNSVPYSVASTLSISTTLLTTNFSPNLIVNSSNTISIVITNVSSAIDLSISLNILRS